MKKGRARNQRFRMRQGMSSRNVGEGVLYKSRNGVRAKVLKNLPQAEAAISATRKGRHVRRETVMAGGGQKILAARQC